MTDKIYSIDEIKHLVAPVAKEFELNEIYLARIPVIQPIKIVISIYIYLFCPPK